MSEPLWWSHRDHTCPRGWLVRRRVRRVRAALEALRTHESRPPSEVEDERLRVELARR